MVCSKFVTVKLLKKNGTVLRSRKINEKINEKINTYSYGVPGTYDSRDEGQNCVWAAVHVATIFEVLLVRSMRQRRQHVEQPLHLSYRRNRLKVCVEVTLPKT